MSIVKIEEEKNVSKVWNLQKKVLNWSYHGNFHSIIMMKVDNRLENNDESNSF